MCWLHAQVKLKNGLRAAMSISSLGNAYLQDSQFWKLFKEARPLCSLVMRTAAGVVHLLATLLEPFMPSFSYKVGLGLGLGLGSGLAKRSPGRPPKKPLNSENAQKRPKTPKTPKKPKIRGGGGRVWRVAERSYRTVLVCGWVRC